MDDVVAVAVTTSTGHVCYFITWGRIQDPVDPGGLEDKVLSFARRCATPGEPVAARLCTSLREARDAPYFYEALVSIAQVPIPFGTDTYPRWREETDKAMSAGKQIHFVGPNRNWVENSET